MINKNENLEISFQNDIKNFLKNLKNLENENSIFEENNLQIEKKLKKKIDKVIINKNENKISKINNKKNQLISKTLIFIR